MSIYHYLGAELKLLRIVGSDMSFECENINGIKSVHHISELKADGGMKEIMNRYNELDK